MKKISALLLVLVLALSMVACSSKTEEKKEEKSEGSEKYVIGVSLRAVSDEFMVKLNNGLKEGGESYENLDLKIVEANNDPAKQLSQIEQFVAEGVDAVIINCVDKESSAAAIQVAVDEDIPVVVVNSGSTPEAMEIITSYVGSDSVESGNIEMKYVAEEILKGEGKIAYMNGQMGHEAQIGRREGAMQILEENPGIEIVLEGDTDWDRAKGLELTENWINSGVEFDMVITQDVNIGMGAVIALREAGLSDQIKVACIDVSADGVEALKAGEVTNLVFQDAYGQGFQSVAIAMEAASGKDVEKEVMIPYELVTIDNVDDYVS